MRAQAHFRIVKDFGVSETTLHNWLKKADIEDGNGQEGTVTLSNQALIVVDPCSETSCSCVTHEAGGILGRPRMD